MFTGIVQGKYPVVKIENKGDLKTFVVQFLEGNLEGLKIGASVALNGACLTVTNIDGQLVSFDLMLETLQKTNLGDVQEGGFVNVERSARIGDEIGGHVMSGHIIDTAEIVRVHASENNHVVTFRVRADVMKYILDKGFIGLDGCSLTVVNPNKETGEFDVWLIPETLRLTMYSERTVGDKVNVELDSRTQAIIETVEHYLATK